MKFTKKQLLLSLIRDDLINHRLVMGLNNLGLVSELYLLNAGDTVFKLMNIREEIGKEYHFAWYMNMKDEVLKLDFQHNHFEINVLAEKIYRELRSIQSAGK